MLHPKRVIVYGDSIFLSGIAETLRADLELRVVEIQTQNSEVKLKNSQPDIVVVDSSQISLDQVSLLMLSFPSRPGLPFISLNADAKQLTVLSSQQYPAVSLPDLTQILKKF